MPPAKIGLVAYGGRCKLAAGERQFGTTPPAGCRIIDIHLPATHVHAKPAGKEHFAPHACCCQGAARLHQNIRAPNARCCVVDVHDCADLTGTGPPTGKEGLCPGAGSGHIAARYRQARDAPRVSVGVVDVHDVYDGPAGAARPTLRGGASAHSAAAGKQGLAPHGRRCQRGPGLAATTVPFAWARCEDRMIFCVRRHRIRRAWLAQSAESGDGAGQAVGAVAPSRP